LKIREEENEVTGFEEVDEGVVSPCV